MENLEGRKKEGKRKEKNMGRTKSWKERGRRGRRKVRSKDKNNGMFEGGIIREVRKKGTR